MQNHLHSGARSEQAILLCSHLDGSVQLSPTHCASSGSTQHKWGLPEYKGHMKGTLSFIQLLQNGDKTSLNFQTFATNKSVHQHKIPDTEDHVRKKKSLSSLCNVMLDCGMMVQLFFPNCKQHRELNRQQGQKILG